MTGLKKFLAAALLLCQISAMASDAAESGRTADILTEQTGFTPACDWGTTRRYHAHCDALDADYTVDVLLPEGYDPADGKRYPVVYMHDGQNLVDPSISFGGVSWEVDKALKTLSQWNEFRTPIIVGIHNRGAQRPADYLCQKVITDYIPADRLAASGIMSVVDGKLSGDAYAEFVAVELKQAIDAEFQTLTERDNTFIMGSSMGGLASLYALCEYPEVFGGAACLSTHWIGNFDYANTIFPNAMLAYMADCLPSAETHRLYFDHGTEGLDSAYPKWNDKALEMAESKGYGREGKTMMSYVADGADHNEYYWSKRVNIPLQFMLDNGNHPLEPIMPGNMKFHVVFCDPDVSWTKVNAFTWGGGVTQTGAWPGKAMTRVTYEGKPAWEITFEHAVVPTNIIFNDITAKGTTQTADLEFVNNSVYDFSGVKGVLSSVSDVCSDSRLKIRTIGGNLYIDAEEECTVSLVNLNGTIRKVNLHQGENILTGISESLLIINGQKYLLPM